MKKLLPIIMLLAASFWLLAIPSTVSAASNPATPTPTPSTNSNPGITQGNTADGWTPDPDVTFVGQVGARSGQFLDWTLANYQWSYTSSASQYQQVNPLLSFWATIRNIIYGFLVLFILASAFILMITRGRNITLRRFLVRFLFVIVLIAFSFSLLQFIYATADFIQGRFLINPDYNKIPNATPFISQKNLLFVGFDYNNGGGLFKGYKLTGDAFGSTNESAFMSLLLVKLTAITYYVMSGILLVRKIILWLFVIVSPVFPLLLFFRQISNTAKIWVGEFFRWLLYGPLFAIFLSGLVIIWRAYIPLHFNFVDHPKPSTQQSVPNANGQPTVNCQETVPNSSAATADPTYRYCYPTAVNILLGGPGQTLSMTNNVNYIDTFAEYVVALLMLWVVIILPFILLQIFLDYLNNTQWSENAWVTKLMSTGSNYMNKIVPPSPAPVVPPAGPSSTGLAKELPFSNKMAMQLPVEETRRITTEEINKKTNIVNSQINQDILKTADLSVPNLRDIAKFETSMLSSSSGQQAEAMRSQEMLKKIANPNLASSTTERQKILSLRSKLTEQKSQGNPLAASILTAANSTLSASAVTQTATPEQRAVMHEQAKVNSELQRIRDQGHTGEKLAQVRGAFPTINRVQTVSIEDYESVKKMWEDTYRKISPPKAANGKEMDRKAWIQGDIDKINSVTNLLVSSESHKVNEGMDMVARILPFLLIGGFSQTEVVAYLKAKQEAAKAVLGEITTKQQEEEETTLGATSKKQEKPKEMQAQVEDDSADSPPESPKDLPENQIFEEEQKAQASQQPKPENGKDSS